MNCCISWSRMRQKRCRDFATHRQGENRRSVRHCRVFSSAAARCSICCATAFTSVRSNTRTRSCPASSPRSWIRDCSRLIVRKRVFQTVRDKLIDDDSNGHRNICGNVVVRCIYSYGGALRSTTLRTAGADKPHLRPTHIYFEAQERVAV
jgi:hypothetical protein